MNAHQTRIGNKSGDRSAAYTLVEYVAALALLGILAGVLLPSVQRARRESRPTAAKQQLQATNVAGTTYEPQACCLPGGRECTFVDPRSCAANQGSPLGAGTFCEGDHNSNDVDDACEPDRPCENCGFENHWVDQCAGGLDQIPSGALVGFDTDLDCRPDGFLVLQGPMVLTRTRAMDDSSFFPGTRPNDGHLDVMDTEILSMDLVGGGARLVAGAGHGGGGAIADLDRNSTTSARGASAPLFSFLNPAGLTSFDRGHSTRWPLFGLSS